MKPRPTLTKQYHPTSEAHPSRTTPPAREPLTGAANSDAAARCELIAAEAYLLAERRGFAPGAELDDWLAAEAIVDGRLREADPVGQRSSRN